MATAMAIGVLTRIVQRLLCVRKRDVHDRRVQDDHQLRDDDDGEREPAAVAAGGCRGDGRVECGDGHVVSPLRVLPGGCAGADLLGRSLANCRLAAYSWA